MPLGCAVHHLACAVRTWGAQRNGQVFTFACMWWCNIVRMKMLHRTLIICDYRIVSLSIAIEVLMHCSKQLTRKASCQKIDLCVS